MKIRNLMGAVVALVGITSCGAAFAGGSVWEVLPGTPVGTTHTSNERISFRMRLLSPNWDRVPEAADRFGWRIRLTSYGRTLYSNEYLAWAGAPMKLGVVLNGKTVGADWGRYEEGSDELKDSGAFVPAKDNIFHDMHFTYTTRCGDYALPLRLAADEKGTPIGGEHGNNYFFINGPGDPTAIWEIVAVSNGYDVADYTFESQASTLGPGSSEIKPPYSYNDLDPDEQGNVRRLLTAGDYLRHNAYTVETLKFDDVREKTRTGEEYWRVVSEAGDDSGYVVTADEGFTPTVADTEVYAWIEPDVDRNSPEWIDPASWTANDYAVTIPSGASVTNAFFRDPDGTERYHRVYRIKLGSTASYRVPLHGQHRGRTARVVLASTPHYNYLQDGTGTFLLDYRTAEVYCDEPAAPTVAVSLENLSADRTIRYGSDGTYADARELRVWLNQATNEDMKVKLNFAWGEGGANTAFPTNVIAISTDSVDGYLEKNLLKDMEVTIPAGETELPDGKRIYLFVLGATKSTENPEEGITITPVPEAKFASFIQTTNAQPFRIIGMNPGLISPLGTKEEPAALTEIRGGSKLRCRVVLDDSWRNMNLSSNDLAAAGGYTVRWNRGYGAELTITNDYNGNVLKPVMNSDGHAWFDIGVEYTSVTGTYHASFVVTNPEGHESVVSYVDVTTIPRATVAASLPDMPQTADGFYETMESDADKRTVRFQLSDILEADGQALWAFLEPANEAASNRTDGAFFTKRADGTAGTGVPVDTMSSGMGSTALNYKLGGIQVLDGDGSGKGDGSTAQFNVILCTQETYSESKVFDGYDGTGAITLLLDNHEPELKQLVISEVIKTEGSATTNAVDVITASGKTAANRVHKGNDVIVNPMTIADWKDVARDINATNENLMVTRWLVYRVNDDGEKERWDAYYTYGPNEKLVIPGGLTVYNNKETTYLFEVQIQDKDMRALGTAGLIEDEDEPSGWVYRIYKDLPTFEPDWAGDDESNVWGPAFTFTVLANAKPNVDIVVREQGSTEVQGVRAFTEDQLAPLNNSIYNDDDMRLVVSLAEQFDRKTEVKVKLTLSAVDGMNVNGGFVELAETNVYFVGANRTAEVKISDFDATYRDGKVQRGNAKYQVTAEVVEPAAAVEKYNATTCQFFVVNRPPRLELGAGSQQFSEYVDNADLAYDVAKNDIQTVDWSATDIHWDLTNISVKATISGGKILDGDGVEYTTYAYAATNSAVVATNYEDGAYNVVFKFKFSNSGTNTITFVATDKDGDSSERHVLRFAIPETKTLLLYPAKPTQPSTDSDDVADYFSAAGIGYGRVWADGDTKLSAIDKWIHDWTCSQGGVAKVYAMGYLANERENLTSDAFVSKKGNHDTSQTGYAPADENDKFKYLDSFFYRWFAKLVAESGSDSNWTAYKPVPQVSTNRDTSAAGTVMSMSFPKKTGMNDREYNDISALAIFSRELLWSDNMGDINADGVPDSYVVKYKLVEEFAGGNDLNDVNFAEDGKAPNCLDYLPQTDGLAYSKLIPALTSYDNIKNATAFTPRLKIRGYDETDELSLNKRKATYGAIAGIIPGISALNDAADMAGIDGAKPDRKYTNPREDADSTLNYVEYLAWSEYAAANKLDPTNALNWTEWSPERPTDPTKADFDNDGFTDGYEYYVWYRAHVGWIDKSGVHRYLTGREYDPRNPGEGKFITSEKIEQAFDPRLKHGSETDDIDNDGLPDLLEFEIGTNPFDFDTDGDGLPDGWEVMISGTDPLKVVTSGNLSDAMRNYDGDAMAFTTPKLEGMQLPVPLHTDMLTSFALVKADGDTDGVQWYAGKAAPTGIGVLKDEQPGTSFTVGGVTYVARGAVPVVTNVTAGLLSSTTNVVIAKDLLKELTWTALSTNAAPEGVAVNAGLIALMPTHIPAGTPLDPNTEVVAGTYATLQFTNVVKGVNTAWVYGRETVSTQTTGDGLANLGGFGMLAIGRYEDAPKGLQIAAIPAENENVAYLHYLVYQEFGFDPRTAWNANTPLATRWGPADGEEGKANNYNGSYGYAGVATRTREYTAYDEFLVYSFFLNNGMTTLTYEVLDDDAPLLAEIWYANTTNPRGPGEPELFTDGASGGEGSNGVKYYGRDSDNGADTDGDGVPDGWELYVMAGPKVGGKYHFAFPYNDGYYSAFGPFEPHAGESSYTDNSATGANDSPGGDGDKLTELQEFAGTDSCAWYSRPQKGNEKAFSTTIVRPKEHRKWMNKFFPTDPWDPDTDKDGIVDAQEIKRWGYSGNPAWFECANFLYGTPVDDNSASIPGGGLNPCSIDTDGDGLPDLWEAQFAGHTPYAGPGVQYAKGIDADGNEDVEGNPRQGLCDGMDGTVSDAFTYPIRGTAGTTNFSWTVVGTLNMVVNRDYDHDGLENWQEYMTGLMRCWRYDDPLSRWDYIPDDWYWNEDGAFAPKLEMFGFKSMDEFWTETLANPQSRFYNPHLVSGMNPAKYMSRVKNGWDRAYTDEGTYYWMCDRIGDTRLADLWGHTPLCYASCSPIDSDSDQDGMDDYYELFHGLNPLLGLSGKEATSGAEDGMAEKRGPCDLIYSAYMGSGTTLEAWNGSGDGNGWQKDPVLKAKSRSKVAGGYDFIVYPWLNGLQLADPDGDDIRNVNEAIMPKLATETWNHTDPTPLWMTDSSYSNSLVRMFFRMPARFGEIPLEQYGADPCFSNTLNGAICYFRDCDGYRPMQMMPPKPKRFVAYNPDRWDLAADGKLNWMFSFEENEGYDTDHDGSSDYEEGQGKYRSATDMQDFDSPRRRQAMYFPGKDAALQTPPLEIAHHPIDDTLKAEPEFLTYTVECWVMPEEVGRDQVIFERAIWTDFAKPGDEEFMRKNFQLAIRDGMWYTKFDPNGTLANNAVEIYSTTAAEVGKWTHLAATYDGSTLNFYVNGVAQVAKTGLSLQPEHGESVLAVRTEDGGFSYGIGDYWFDRDYGYQAFVVGASVRGRMGTGADGKPTAVNERGYLALDLSRGIGWDAYTEFFKGYVDEISVWDGARSFDDVYADYAKRVRLDRTAAIENRSALYKDWSTGKRRAVRGDALVPELRYHWSFDSLFAAENPKVVAKVPHGFDIDYGAAYLSRPAGYTVDWWRKVVEGDAGTFGYGSVYAGRLDWVAWIPNTVAHLPFYDGTTLDSVLWSANYCGDRAGSFAFPRTAEPVSKWTQMTYNGVGTTLEFQTTGSRHRFVNDPAATTNSTQTVQFEFTNRNLELCGADLLPLGGAFVKYCPTMWDDQGASSMWEQTQTDADNNGIADWWDEYADQNYRLAGTDSGTRIDWDEIVDYHGIPMTAGQAYLRDLAKGYYLDAYATMHPLDPETEDRTEMKQTAKSDGMIPDWWKELMKIDGQEPVADTDNDGLNNYVEYVASELLPFRLDLNPRMARSDTMTLDYFRRVGKLYLGEMLTDHDQMEDHWERSLGDETVASAAVWDALKDGEEDGWNNFAENRYNGYSMSTLAQLVAHAMGDYEVMDAPIPSIKMKVRYNGDRPLVLESQTGNGENIDDNVTVYRTPALIVTAFSKNADTGSYVLKPDAIWTVRPGVPVEKEVYLGGWEDRVVRGTLAPGNVDIGTLDIKFAQVPQSDLYSWTDESGTHLAGTYKEFKEAFDKNPNIIQNIQNFQWLSLVAPINEYTLSDRAVTVTRDKQTQKGYIAVYGERVGTINLTTGDFEFDLGAMNKLRVNYTYDGGKGPAAAWSYKEAIFKITYTATVPSEQLKTLDFSLAMSDKNIITPDGHVVKASFVHGGLNSIEAFYDLNNSGIWDPGEPFGVVNDVDIGWAGRDIEIELSDMSAVTPRVKLWGASGKENGGGGGQPTGEAQAGASAADSDRGTRVGVETFSDVSNRFEIATAPASKSRVRVVRYKVDKFPVYTVGVNAGVVLEKDFEQTSRDFLHEGDFLADGDLDIDWANLYTDVVDRRGTQMAGCEITNVTYLIVYNWDESSYRTDDDTNSQVKANATLVTRRFEVTRTVPTPCPERAVYNLSQPTFAWKIENEDKWASWFGTTYTAFKVRVKDLNGDLVYDSGIRRLPARDADGVYSWTAPLYVGEVVPETGVLFANLTDYTWEVAVYNAKFKTDTLYAMERNDSTGKRVFSAPRTFRMNVTDMDASSCALATRVCYAGPATWLEGRIRLQAFASPDFTGDPVAELTLGDVSAEALSPSVKTANAKLIGLPEGNYFLRAYIDTNGNGVHDEWESWGYLNERDLASKSGIFNPVAAAATLNPSEANVRQLLIEDCDTDGDWFPDVWEAELNEGVFDPEVVKPVTGDAELIGVNTNLDANLTKEMQGLGILASANGFSLLTGVNPARVRTTVAADGTSRFSVDNKVDSVTISSLDFDADGNVVIRIDAKTSVGAVDPVATAIYDLDLSKTVTCRIYRKTNLASPGWGDPVAEETVTVGAGPVTIPVEGEKAAQAFYRAEIVEK